MGRIGAWSLNLTIFARTDAAGTFTNMPSADTFLFSSHRHVQVVDLEGMSQVRFKVSKQATAGQAGSKLILRYATSFSTSVSAYSDIGTSEVSVGVDVQNVYLDTDWIDLNDNAKTDVYLAVVGSGGNGTLDPTFGIITVAFQ